MFSRLTHIWDKKTRAVSTLPYRICSLFILVTSTMIFGNSINEIIGSYRDYSISSIEKC